MIEDQMFWWVTTNGVASLTITIGLFFLIYQTIKCLEYPRDKNRQRHLLLLCLILIYNTISSFLPDKTINIPIVEQHLLCYAGKLVVLAYCSFYLYKSFGISALRFHARWGIWLFLTGPIFISISCTGSALTAVKAVAISYSFISVCVIGSAIYKKYRSQALDNLKEVLLLFLALVIWGLVFMMFSEISQLGILILSNMGFLPFLIFYVKEEFRSVREQEFHIQAMDHDLAEKDSRIQAMTYDLAEVNVEILRLRHLLEASRSVDNFHVIPVDSDHFEIKEAIPNDQDSSILFEENCKKYLTKVQAVVIKMVDQGLTYEEIAKRRKVKLGAIKKAMSNIGKRLKIKGKESILIKMKSKIK
jgi:DNA-binding CsgD family transcriptional regulator